MSTTSSRSTSAPASLDTGATRLREPDELPGPRGLPWIGSLHRWRLSRVHLLLEHWAGIYGPSYRLRLGPHRIIVISDPALARQALRERPHDFSRHFAVRPIFGELGIEGVFSAEGESWRQQRPMVMRALDPGHLRRFFPVLQTATEHLHDRWLAAATRAQSVDVRSDLTRYTVDVTCSLAFGSDTATLTRDDPDPLQRHLDRIFAGIGRRMNSMLPTWRWFRSRADRRLEQSLQVAAQAVRGFIDAARAQLEARPELRAAPANLLQALLVANEEARLTDRELAGNVLTLLLAGEDTTANTIAWSMHLLAQSPQTQQRVRAEAREAIGPGTTIASFDAMRELPLIEGTVLEALRLKPVAPVNMLSVLRDTQLGDLLLPRRSLVALLSRPAVLDPSEFAQPEAFRPERWQGTDGGETGARRAFMPFGAGPRFCPGRYLALVEAKMVLATTLAAFELKPGPGRVTERYSFTMNPSGLRLRLQPLRPSAPAPASASASASVSAPSPASESASASASAPGLAPERRGT